MFTCAHIGCSSKKHSAKGYCEKHYTQLRRHGKTFCNTQRDFNEIVDCGSYYELILTNNKNEEKGRAKIDKEDLHKVKSVGRWSLNSDGYVYNGHNSILLHRVILSPKDSEQVDHRKTGKLSKLDNRKDNLRVCSDIQNKHNVGLRKTNKSGFKGVSWSKEKRKWCAQIFSNRKCKKLGYFSTPEEASRAYIEAAKILQKSFIHASLTG